MALHTVSVLLDSGVSRLGRHCECTSYWTAVQVDLGTRRTVVDPYPVRPEADDVGKIDPLGHPPLPTTKATKQNFEGLRVNTTGVSSEGQNSWTEQIRRVVVHLSHRETEDEGSIQRVTGNVLPSSYSTGSSPPPSHPRPSPLPPRPP